MYFDYINVIQDCVYFVQNDAPLALVRYSHSITVIVALFLSIFVYKANPKNILNRLFFAISIVFSAWVVLDYITWVSFASPTYMFYWSFFSVLTALLYLLCVYFYDGFLNKGRLNPLFLWGGLLIISPIVLLTPTVHNLSGFDELNCISIEAPLLTNYAHMTGILAFLLILFLYIKSLIRKDENNPVDKTQATLMFVGLELFITVFFSATFLDTYFVLLGLTGDYTLGNYGLFGVLLFLAAVAFIIVRFRTFNTKLLGAQALVWAMVILIGSQFFFIQNDVNRVLNAVTFAAVSIAGLMLVRSVKEVDSQRELLERSNQNQESLLHFITHQVKGYMTKSRNIFDGILVGDYGDTTDQIKEISKYGFDSETRGVETVLAILKASDLKTGKTKLQKSPNNVSAIIAGLIEHYLPEANKKGLEMTFDIEPNIEINVDPVQIKEVFKNLLLNAIIYTQKGTVHVDFKKEGKYAVYTVADTGFGLTPEDKSQLFTEGGKSKDSLSVNIDSTGYGLFVAKQITERHNGTIGARSEGRNKGSEFFVKLPLIQ